VATVTVDSLVLGEAYDRPYLARLWGYEGPQAIARGVITPAGQRVIVLFVTKIKQSGYTQYENRFEGDVLHMEGERGDAPTNARLKNASTAGDRIYLFYRERHHSDFIFYGEASIEHIAETPDRIHFSLRTQRSDAIASNALATEEEAHGTTPYIPDEEGRRRLAQHVSYERSRTNRAEAIRLHGTRCAACGFDFNAFYGSELARDYIEIHHIESITAGVRTVDAASALIPLCANCHAMVHRSRGEILTVDALRKAIERCRTV
jgi:5-methylcytosine-specific restriction protein A